MADTLPNIPIVAGEWRDIYALTGIAVGTRLVVENTGTCDVYLAVQAAQPPDDHDEYNIVKRKGPKLTNNSGDSGAWAFCGHTDGELNVSIEKQNGFHTASPGTSTTPIIITDGNNRDVMASMNGELQVGTRVDDISVNFQYGVSAFDIVDGGVSSGTGSVSESNSMALVSSGAGVGEAEIVSKASVRYRAGHESYCFVSAVLGTPEAGVNQYIGLLNGDDGWSVGYQGTVFGLWFIEGGNINFIAQADFNIDILDGSGVSGYDINPQTGQLYKLSFTWHGFLDLVLEVRTADGSWVPAHKEVFVNSATQPHLQNPNLPITAKVERLSGSGADIVIGTGSWRGGSIAGTASNTSSDRWFSHTVLDRSLSNQRNNIFTLRNKLTFNGKINHIAVEVAVTDYINDANKSVAVYGVRNATLAGNGPFTDVDTGNSVMEFSDGGSLSGGTQGPAAPVKSDEQRTRDIRGTGVIIYPGEDFTLEVDPGGPINGNFTGVFRFVEYH